MTAAITLFDNVYALPEIKTALAAYGYDDAPLAHERAMIAAFEAAN